MEKLELPQDCSGLRILDIGARDGYFSFLLEQRGAREVIAVDYMLPEKMGVSILHDIFDSKVQFDTDNIYSITPEKYGTFDIGLLYHLRNTLLALDRVREFCTNELYVESYIINEDLNKLKNLSSSPLLGFVKREKKQNSWGTLSDQLRRVSLMRFYPKDELNNNYTNWWDLTMFVPHFLSTKQL